MIYERKLSCAEYQNGNLKGRGRACDPEDSTTNLLTIENLREIKAIEDKVKSQDVYQDYCLLTQDDPPVCDETYNGSPVTTLV